MTRMSALIFILLIFLAAAALLIYFLLYKRRVNRVLQEEKHSSPMPEPRNVGYGILIVIAAVCVIVLFIKVSDLKSQISDLQSQYNYISNQIEQIYDDFDERLKEENSLLSTVDYVCTDADFSRGTATVCISVVPKSYSENTSVSITFGNYRADLAQNADGIFSGSVDVDISEELYFDKAIVVISENNQKQTEAVELDLNGCWLDLLPIVEMTTSDFDYTYHSGEISLSDCVDITVTPSEYDVLKMSTVIEINGQTVDETDITDRLVETNRGTRTATIDLSGIYEVNDYNNIYFFIKYEDTAGLVHKVIIECISDVSGFLTDGEIIYDQSGNVLYDTTE